MDITGLKDLAATDGSLFAGLTDSDLAACAEKFDVREVLAGSTLIREGDFSYRFFVMLDGEATVLRDFDTLATFGPGDCFGETGVLGDQPRNARIVATERSRVASMIGWDFRALCDEIPVLGDRIQAIIGERAEPVAALG